MSEESLLTLDFCYSFQAREECLSAIVRNISASVELLLAVAYSHAEQCFYAWSPQLRCLRDGDSEAEALAMCREAAEVLIESLLERGTLDSRLAELGYSVVLDPQAHSYTCLIREGYLFNAEMLGSMDVELEGVLPSLLKQTIFVEAGAQVV